MSIPSIQSLLEAQRRAFLNDDFPSAKNAH